MSRYQRRMRPLLGTFVEIGLLTDSPLDEGFDLAFQAIEDIQSRMSFHNPDSELSQLNASPGNWQTLSADTYQLLLHAKFLAQKTEERFNVTVGGALVKNGLLPQHVAHDYLLTGQADDIELSDQKARLKRPVLITLDGIAKGFAVDSAVERLVKAGYLGGWVNAGGDVRAFGEKNLSVQIRGFTGGKNLYQKAMATSQIGLDATSEFPAQIINRSDDSTFQGYVSVIADKTWIADALTKVVGFLNKDHEAQLIQEMSIEIYRHRLYNTDGVGRSL